MRDIGVTNGPHNCKPHLEERSANAWQGRAERSCPAPVDLEKQMMRRGRAWIVGALIAWVAFALPSWATQPLTGLNVVNPVRLSRPQQDVLIDQLARSGVEMIRTAVPLNESGVDFVRRLDQKGIRVLLNLELLYQAGAPVRPYQPERYPEIWAGPALSYADPLSTKGRYRQVLDQLERSGIVLAGIEVGNEINWTAFNAEFPLPGRGRNLGLLDLHGDEVGQKVAKGYRQYVQVLHAIKDVRDQSRLNRSTPLLSAGLADTGAEGWLPRARYDSVSIGATLRFLRQHGLDSLVDGYGIHSYPGAPNAADRRRQFFDLTAHECGAQGATGDAKPCWITEWGFPNASEDCPGDDEARAALFRETKTLFRELARQGRLRASIAYAWNGEPWSKEFDRYSLYRCNRLTESGQLAIAKF